ncbi:MAG: DUF1905 domain-containing protein [Candidatus Flexifilum sp.]
MIFEFTEVVFVWRGPAPYYFVALPADQSEALRSIAGQITYGWGVIPVTVAIGSTRWTTSLIPKAGRYLVPLKDAVRRAEGLNADDIVTVRVTVAEP